MMRLPEPDISGAVARLRAGGIVAFATETVYGLGADATNANAVKKIFVAKGRPLTNPLIVHVADATIAKRYAAGWPDEAEKLAAAFWPGPLTLVVPRGREIVNEVSAGLETVGLRSPDHPLALRLLREFDGPIAAPSANRSNHISPTTAEHVRSEFGSSVDLILDGGPCRVGIESTVIDLSTPEPIILRPGQVTREQIERCIGPVKVFAGNITADSSARSPGQQELHYAPRAPAFGFEESDARSFIQWRQRHPLERCVILIIEGSMARSEFERSTSPIQRLIFMPADATEYARRLYSTLRAADESNPAGIWIELPPDRPAWAAVRDRIRRATHRS
jgi:L-threonylcarbamoyladenylate synthase